MNELTLQDAGYGQANLVDEIVQCTVNQITKEINYRVTWVFCAIRIAQQF